MTAGRLEEGPDRFHHRPQHLILGLSSLMRQQPQLWLHPLWWQVHNGIVCGTWGVQLPGWKPGVGGLVILEMGRKPVWRLPSWYLLPCKGSLSPELVAGVPPLVSPSCH